MAKKDPSTFRPATRLVRGGTLRTNHQETCEPLYLTSGFVYDDAAQADARFEGTIPGYLYGRYANPTLTIFQERLALLEGAQSCYLTASGMAAIHTAIMAPLKTGSRVVAARALFGSCRWILDNLMPRYGIEVELVDGADNAQWAQALARKPCDLVLIETPANPNLDAVDLRAVSSLAKQAGALVVVDNVFATPILQRPLELGADVVVYSTTKHIDGQGRTLGGAILGDKELLDRLYRDYLRHTGPALSPFNAWVMLKGLETLDLRVRAMQASAARIADLIADHPATQQCLYPGRADHPHYAIHKAQMSGGGTLVAFELKGERKAAWAFLDSLQIVDISNNLGDSKSLATHPFTTTHRAMAAEERARVGVREGHVRLSVGLEDVEDLLEDVAQALDAALAAA